MPIITCTPIAKHYKACAPDSKRDYDEQRYRANKGLRVMWDDSPKNRSRRGDLFVFVHNGRSVTFHRIDDYDSPIDRLPSWSDNVGHGDRNVLYLSDETITMPWTQWIELGGWKKAQGTQTMHNPTDLLTFLHDKLQLEDSYIVGSDSSDE